MPLTFADVKKSISRRNGEVHLLPHLLRPSELLGEMEALIALHEAFLGRPRADFPPDRPAELIGDYRLARGLMLCLGEWYVWQSPEWPGNASAGDAAQLAAHGIVSPGQLRLALYDAVNTTGDGYLPGATRGARLDDFATALGISRATLDELLWLDAEERALLQRSVPATPTPRELSARYNQRVVEAVLINSASVEWLVQPDAAQRSGSNLGSITKRVCFLARRMGVQYDVTFDAPPATEQSTTRGMVAERPARYAPTTPDEPPFAEDTRAADDTNRALCITLFGPQEVSGPPTQYGERLARLCRVLLGYRRKAGADREPALAGQSLRGAARVYLHGRPVTFTLDERVLRFLRAGETSPGEFSLDDDALPQVFDSSLERKLQADFLALERQGEAHGWRLAHEPEPLIVGETILIPDFSFTRGWRRVYLEIAGYWRPEYRERKARKLEALRDHVDIVVAAPESARAAFVGLAEHMPVLWYAHHVSAQALLAVLDRAFDDFTDRLASLDLARLLDEVSRRGCIPATESMAALRCYTRNELATVLQRVAEYAEREAVPPPIWVDGVGLCAHAWRTAVIARIQGWIDEAVDRRMMLDTLRERLANTLPELPSISEAAAETLAGLAGMRVSRSSIFEAVVLPADAPLEELSAPVPLTRLDRKTQPRGRSRRSQHGTSTGTRSLFGEECTSDDAETHDRTPTT